MTVSMQESIASQWVRLGVMLNVGPARETPDVEHLLLDTVRVAGSNSRLFIMAASWLALCGDYVARRRLSVMVRDQLEPQFRPRMGFLLEWAQAHNHRNRFRFRETIAKNLRARSIEDGTRVIKKLARWQLTCRSNSR